MNRPSRANPPVAIYPAAEGAARGVRAWKNRAPHVHIPTSSVRSDGPLANWAQYAQAYAMDLPADAVFSHATAALAWGIPLPRRIEREPVLDVMRARGRPPLVRAGVRSHNGAELRTVVERDGLNVTSVADTWVDLSSPWMGLTVDELIIAGDAACELIAPTRWETEEVHPRRMPGEGDWGEDPALRGMVILWRTLMGRRRHKGKGMLLEAFGHMRPRVWSPMETRSRLLVIRAGLPEPMLNAWVRGPDDEEIPEAAGWRVVEIFKDDIFMAWRRTELIRRLAIHIGVPLERVDPFVRA